MNTLSDRYLLTAEIEHLYAHYCETLDDGRIDLWPEFFVEDCLYRLTTRDNEERGMPLSLVLCKGQAMIRDRALALQKTVMFRSRRQRRMLSGIRLLEGVDGDGEGVKTRASFVLYESVGDEPTRALASGCSHDVVVRRDGALKFKQRLLVVDASVMTDSLVFPV
ncbi:aromatic-ring-hydroxylating dioxygenase subunit beta [Chromobacterium piscinae]|uniref:aromatic-ring-hydroxylating dioxygenase subunit beta n=1 Tax=Chromobacterium piscinae TaxID=686831 RepID=UPI0032099775